MNDFFNSKINISEKGIELTREGRPRIFMTYALKDGHVTNVPHNAEVLLHAGDYLHFIDKEGKIIGSEYIDG